MRLILILFPILLFSKTLNLALSANVSYAMDEIIKEFHKIYKDIVIKKIISSSGNLTSQIQRGAPYDIFLSADMKYPQYLYKNGFAYTKPVVYAKGELVFYSKQNIPLNKINGLKIAIANPKTAPYGKAAIEVINKLHLKPKLIYAQTVAGAFVYAQRNTKGAFLPKSALIMKKFPFQKVPYVYKPIKQGMVIIKPSAEASVFFTFILSKKAQNILKKYGYSD
ncbi:MAG: molybdate ABC transporter substrate-binding protein [Epsilonproteobacteria bacterium]|nr:molybdate ABC transporter substrate-binding protein [Campylobacterota bacterium]